MISKRDVVIKKLEKILKGADFPQSHNEVKKQIEEMESIVRKAKIDWRSKKYSSVRKLMIAIMEKLLFGAPKSSSK